MSIEYAVARAFNKKDIRGWEEWPKMFWVIDVHDVIIPGNYKKDSNSKDFYPGARSVLQWLSYREDMTTILWSASHTEPLIEFDHWLRSFDIIIDYLNENPKCETNELCNFEHKFYFDILLEDKAGFVGMTDWIKIQQTLQSIGEWEKRLSHKQI